MPFEWKEAASLVAVIAGGYKGLTWTVAKINEPAFNRANVLQNLIEESHKELEGKIHEIKMLGVQFEEALKHIQDKQIDSHDQLETLVRAVSVNLARGFIKLHDELKSESKDLGEGVTRVAEKKT